MIATFYGASDDLFVCESEQLTTEIDCYEQTALFKITDGSEGLLVVGSYSITPPGGVWTVGVAPLEEGSPMPTWEARVALSLGGYSTELALRLTKTAVITPLGAVARRKG